MAIWTTVSQYVDVDTGEIVEKNKLYKYKKIKTEKNVTFNTKTDKGKVEYTISVQKKERYQGNLFGEHQD